MKQLMGKQLMGKQLMGKQLMGRQAAAMALALGALTHAGMANAARTQIDGSGESVSTICAAAAATPCATPTALKTSFEAAPLVANFGFGPFSSVYIYSNGIVSIGAPIAPGADFSSLASIGGNVFTAGYSPSMTLSNFTIQGPGPSQFDNFGRPVVRVYYDTKFGSVFQQMEFSIYDLGGGAYELALQHGDFDGDPIDFPADAYVGYSFNGTTVQVSGPTAQAQVRANADFRYVFRNSAEAGVPEPATWAMLLLGFMATGAVLRRPRRGVALAA